MPTWLVIALVAAVVLVDLLVLGGVLAVRRRRREEEPAFHAEVDAANRALATAHALDNGWDPGALRDAARRAFASARPGTEVAGMELVQVDDRPGVEEDRAVFRFTTADGSVHHLTLRRAASGWRSERVA